jgi:Fe-Mn family superoxide dismutase
MKKFEETKFNIGELKGISGKNIEEHLKLYSGYVKNVNGITEKMGVLDSEKDPYIVGELFRRFSFEYNGMRNHEVYFASLLGGSKKFNPASEFGLKLLDLFGTYEKFTKEFTSLALTRGIGWAVLWYDKKDDRFLASWVDEQHLGQLNGTSMILALDMWEHAYVYDYPISEKKKYVEAFFANLNWEVIEENFKKASHSS